MSDQDDWEFAGPTTPRLRSAPRSSICCEMLPAAPAAISCREIIAIVRQVASGLPPEQSNPLDDDMPGG